MYICVCMYVSKWLEPKCPSKAKVWTQPPRPKSFILAILGLIFRLRSLASPLAKKMCGAGVYACVFNPAPHPLWVGRNVSNLVLQGA